MASDASRDVNADMYRNVIYRVPRQSPDSNYYLDNIAYYLYREARHAQYRVSYASCYAAVHDSVEPYYYVQLCMHAQMHSLLLL